jgi:hypothetical protein
VRVIVMQTERSHRQGVGPHRLSVFYPLPFSFSSFPLKVLQREKEDLAHRLRQCAPDRFDRLVAENHTLRRSNAEIDILREQVSLHKRAWQDSESRQMEMKV